MLLVLAEVRLGTRLFFSLSYSRSQTGLKSARGATRSFITLPKVRRRGRGGGGGYRSDAESVAAGRAEPVGGPCCYPRSNKGQKHRPTHALSVGACTHLQTGSGEKGNVRLHCCLRSADCR